MDKASPDIGQGSRPRTGIPLTSRLPAPRANINASHGAREAPASSLSANRALKPTAPSQAWQTTLGKSFSSGAKQIRTRDTFGIQSTGPVPRLLKDQQLPVTSPQDQLPKSLINLPDTLKGDSSGVDGVDTSLAQGLPIKRRPRPSLSDRTIQTLSQIPYTPSPTKRRSGFFTNESPVRNAPRPESAMSSFRSTVGPARPSSPSKKATNLPATSVPIAEQKHSSNSASGKRQIGTVPQAATSTRSSIKPKSSTVRSPGKTSTTTTLRARPGEATNIARYPARKIGSKTISTSPTRKTPSLVSAFNPPSQDKMDKTTSKHGRLNLGGGRIATRDRDASNKSASTVGSTITSKSNTSSRTSLSSPKSPPTDIDQANIRSSPVSKSSSTLRASIAKAKADAAKRNRASNRPEKALRSDIDLQETPDPFSQSPNMGTSKGLLRKRVAAGRSSGILNIAAMDLPAIPDEVMNMYGFDPDAVGSSWAESVDLVKFIGADNTFSDLREDAFPDVDVGNANEDHNLQFRGLEALDLHGNLLKSLPTGIAKLDRLTVLNLAHNQLNMSCLEVICNLENLRELDLSNNLLVGPLPSSIGMIPSLRSLYLQNNEITELENLESLKEIKILNVSVNRLKNLPFESLASLPLLELKAHQNFLFGTLIPSSISSLPRLQALNVSFNALTSISDLESFSFPALRTLDISGNRMTSLPTISTWTSLQTLNAGENSLSSIPPGFTDLENITTANFSSNNLTRLDEKTALMKNLNSMNVQGNPLRDRRFFTLGWEGIKKELLKRLEMGTGDEVESGRIRGGGGEESESRDEQGETREAPRAAAAAGRSRKPEPQMPSWLYGE